MQWGKCSNLGLLPVMLRSQTQIKSRSQKQNYLEVQPPLLAWAPFKILERLGLYVHNFFLMEGLPKLCKL